ncbi:MAG TPA: hypothetical protein PKL39_03705 [Bacillota bacterium]|nr:hypothetical protein [Bacillota bacterium]HPZ90767.1 hypothetical protein [Bacillota bacterium]HQE01721.1 hypothetical protein [Bacillota bacterium]
MKKGALVLELNKSHVTLLTDDGMFVRLPARRLPQARYVGQHVLLDQVRSPRYGRWLPAAAACLALLLLIPLFRPAPVRAWVTLDGSSSLELLVNDRLEILELRPLNDGGKRFLESWQGGAGFETLVQNYLVWARQHGDAAVLVTSTADTSEISKVIEQQAPGVDVLVMSVDPKAREAANKLGVSAGRALFIAGAGHQGINISLEQIKETNPFTALITAGADVEQVLSNAFAPGSQAEKIKGIPLPEPEPKPGDEASGRGPATRQPHAKEAQRPAEKAGKGDNPPAAREASNPANGSNGPPGLAKKGRVLPEISRGNYGNDKLLPPGQAKKLETPARQSAAGKDKALPPGQAKKQGLSREAHKDKGGKGKALPPGLAKKGAASGNKGNVLPPGLAKKVQR